jgi:hypothetical protein
MEYTFVIEKKAKTAGGDRYVCETKSDFNIYFPQTISRKNNIPVETLIVTVSTPTE